MPLSRYELQQVDPYLTGLSVEYANRPDGWIATKLMPILPTGGKVTGRYRKFKKGNRFRNYDGALARLAPATLTKPEMDTDGTFACVEYGYKDGVYDRDRSEFMSQGLSLEEKAVQVLTDNALLAREKRVADILTSASYLTNYSALTGDDRWDQFSSDSSDPFDDIETARNSVHSTAGVDPNVIMIGRQVYNKLRNHPAIIDRVKYTMNVEQGKMTPQILAAAFDVSQVVIGNPLYVSTDEGQTETLSYVWGKNVIVAYVNPSASNESLSLGFIPSVNGNDAPLISSWRDEEARGTWIQSYLDEDEIIVTVDCGYLLQTVVS